MAENIPDGIPQIGPATLALLRQKGIRTNLDVLYHSFPEPYKPASLRDIPGVGPGREALLREWAQTVPLSADEEAAASAALALRDKAAHEMLRAEQGMINMLWVVFAIALGGFFILIFLTSG